MRFPRPSRLALLGLLLLPFLAAAPANAAGRSPLLTFEERVAAQEAIERVYYGHQIGATLPFDEAVPREAIERKVRTSLQQSLALERYWHTPITPEALRREAERIAAATRLPERLEEIYAALGQDPFLLQETLARQTLVDRLSRGFFASDRRIHAGSRRAAEALAERLASGQVDLQAPGAARAVVDYIRLAPGAEPRPEPAAGAAARAGEPDRVELRPQEYARLRAAVPAKVGEIGEIQEGRDAFLVRVVLEETRGRVRVATYAVRKTGWDEWWQQARREIDERDVAVRRYPAAALPGPAALPEQTAGGLTEAACLGDDVWDSSSLAQIPEPRFAHTVVWTGSLMIVWGGNGQAPSISTGGRYDPLTDTWVPTSNLNAPSPRRAHTAIWTGTRMIVWGGTDAAVPTAHRLNTGSRYDPVSDTWTPTSMTNAPDPRQGHVAVWTGSRMVVWGGSNDQGAAQLSGARYDPVGDTWQANSIAGAPEGREGAAGVWTGEYLFVWGGSSSQTLNTGGRYNPVTNTWLPVTQVGAPPLGRYGHTMVWTGSRAIIWGGFKTGQPNEGALDNGGIYDPAADAWTLPTTTGAPEKRYNHTAVWTGTEMIVWGGQSGNQTSTGGRYDPATDTWQETSEVNVPHARTLHSAVWTGSLMVVWGGAIQPPPPANSVAVNTGGRYDPATDSWTPTTTGAGPIERARHTGTWTGSFMVIWGGDNQLPGYLNSGSRYDPATDSWAPMTTVNAPVAREGHTDVWTGTEVIVWGGYGGNTPGFEADLGTGGRYDPITDIWTPVATTGAPSLRAGHTAVWTGASMVIWGGFHLDYLDTGGRYDPATNTWQPTSAAGAPEQRYLHAAVWTGSRMLIWGGAGKVALLATGRQYDPASDVWTPMETTGAPSARFYHEGIWTGTRAIFWGGQAGGTAVNTGGQYDPAGDSWTAIATSGAPSPRYFHSAVWTGSRMIVWGGYDATVNTNTGGRYDPIANIWAATSTFNVPSIRNAHTAVWAFNRMVIWGGVNDGLFLNTGGRYVAGPFADADSDGAPDFCDNCPSVPNANQADDDIDLVGNACDNCPLNSNTAQANTDGDAAGDLCDCAPANGTAFAVPPEVAGLAFAADAQTLSWTSGVPTAGAGTTHDLARGQTNQFPVGSGAAETCAAPAVAAATATDTTTPASRAGLWYLVRAANACGQGPYGTRSNGTPRTTSVCP